jgi:hypothetical protein
LFVLALTIPFALWIGSCILRAAIGLTNKVLGGADPTDLDFYGAHSGYRDGRYPQQPTRAGLLIPVPSAGRAMGIVLFIGVVDFVIQFGIMMAAGAGSIMAGQGLDGGSGQAMAALISIPVSFVIHIGMLSSLLPTTMGRAFLVVVFQLVFCVLIALLIGVVVAVFATGLVGR